MHTSPTLQLSAAFLTFGLAQAAPAQWGHGSGNWGNQWQYPQSGVNVQLGPRPYYLVDNMDEGPLKERLQACKEQPKSTSSFSISHRGAPLMFPEHSKQGYEAAIRMGAGK